MIDAQTMMKTDLLIALMIMAALVGFCIDRIILTFSKLLAKWRFVS